MLTYMYELFMVVIQYNFPQFADGLGNFVQAWDLIQVLLNLVDLNLQVVQILLNFDLVKPDARYTSQLIADLVGISKVFALRFLATCYETEEGKY